MGTEDRELVEKVLSGATEEFRELVERHQNAIYRFALGLIGKHEEAQDITQDVFLSAHNKIASFDSSRAAFSTWLFTITRNCCINWLKRKRPVESSQMDLVAKAPCEDSIVNKELSAQLDSALAELPLEQKSAFLLAEFECLPYAEIATIENTTLGTVKSRIHRAKNRLKELLQPVYGKEQ